MVEVKKYHLPPTALIPNSPYPLLHYPNLFVNPNPLTIHETLASNNWQTQWIYRYGPTQQSHYHSTAHECMIVLSGSATIRFGVADTVSDMEESTHGSGKEEGGIEVHAQAGDLFILPAGLAHKTFDTQPKASFDILTPGDGHANRVEAGVLREALGKVELEGFTMMGAYPEGSEWDSAQGGEDVGEFERVWSVRKPDSDPVLGKAKEGLCGLWQSVAP